MHQCVGYTDFALKKFFESSKNSDWFDDTIFIFTADHGNQTFYPFYKKIHITFIMDDQDGDTKSPFTIETLKEHKLVLTYRGLIQTSTSECKRVLPNTTVNTSKNKRIQANTTDTGLQVMNTSKDKRIQMNTG